MLLFPIKWSLFGLANVFRFVHGFNVRIGEIELSAELMLSLGTYEFRNYFLIGLFTYPLDLFETDLFAVNMPIDLNCLFLNLYFIALDLYI